jgi:hypothetical protein
MKPTLRFLLLTLLVFCSNSLLAQKKKSRSPEKTVKAAATADSTGMLTGKVNIGPLCAVEPCNVTPQQLAAACKTLQLIVTNDEKKFIQKYELSATGTFSMRLPAGLYHLLVQPKEGFGLDNSAKDVKVEPGKTVKIVLDYDTGMR